MESQKMKCMHFDDEKRFPDVPLKVCDAEIPIPGENEVLIKVHASSVNRIDVL